MTIEINSFFGSIYNSFYSVTGLNKIFSSVVYTSILISGLIVLLLMFLYPCKKNTPLWILFKIFIYILTIMVFTLSIHNSLVRNRYKSQYQDTSINNMMDTIHGGRNDIVYNNEKMQVNPKLNTSCIDSRNSGMGTDVDTNIIDDGADMKAPHKLTRESISEMLDDLEA